MRIRWNGVRSNASFSPRETYSWAYRLLHMIFYLNEVYARTPDTLTVHSATHSQLC